MNTEERLKLKANSKFNDGTRMPSIISIHKLLLELNVKHTLNPKTNIVEHKNKGNRYVNSRRRGKKGWILEIPSYKIKLDTSDSYYSWNSRIYAKELLDVIKKEKEQLNKSISEIQKN